jgi:serine/threonine-protein kinase RsbW
VSTEPSRVDASSGDRNLSGDDSLSLIFANDHDALHSAREAVREYLLERGVDEAATYAVDLTLEELAGNTIRYGYDGEEKCAIRADVAVSRMSVRITLSDDARQFDPTLHPIPKPPRSLDEAPVGGRGISMVRRVVRAMRYRREAGRNCIEVDVSRVRLPT